MKSNEIKKALFYAENWLNHEIDELETNLTGMTHIGMKSHLEKRLKELKMDLSMIEKYSREHQV